MKTATTTTTTTTTRAYHLFALSRKGWAEYDGGPLPSDATAVAAKDEFIKQIQEDLDLREGLGTTKNFGIFVAKYDGDKLMRVDLLSVHGDMRECVAIDRLCKYMVMS